MLRSLGRLLLAVAILVATQGALEHPLVHVKSANADVHSPSGFDDDHPEDVAHSCDVCLAFASLGGIPDSASGIRPLDVAHAYPASSGGEHLPRAPPPFRSHAPPFLS